MIGAAIELTLLAWFAYCAWRVLSAPLNAVQVDAEVIARCPNKFAFQTYMKIREYYLQLIQGHKKYELHGTNLTQDVTIDVWEQAGFQFVKHKYRVTMLVPNERMNLISEQSQVRILGLFKSQSQSEVEFQFRPASETEAALGLTIRIVFPNRLRHLLARLFFTEAIWQSHAKKEMAALAKVMEQRYTESEGGAGKVKC